MEQCESPVITGSHQFCRICLGIALIFSLEYFRERNIFNRPFATIFDDAVNEIIECMSCSGTAVIDTGKFRMFPEIKDDIDYIIDIDEIAYLFSIAKAACTFKKRDFSCFLQFMILLIDKRCHTVLMVFLRAKYVKITESYNLTLR